MVSSRNLYIAAGTSRSSVSDARHQDGLVAYGAGRLIALWNSASPTSNGVHRVLPGHEGDVTALKFVHSTSSISNSQSSQWLVTGDSKGAVKIWQEQHDGSWNTTVEMQPHTLSVSALAVLPLPQSQGHPVPFLLVTGSSDGSLQAWTITADGTAELKQKIDTKGKFPLALELTYLPASSSIALVMGSTEAKIQVFSSSTRDGINFTRSLSLDGHSDWVRCLAFTCPIPMADDTRTTTQSASDIAPGELLLASGSQDNYIRLWRFSRVSTNASDTSTRNGVSDGFSALDELDRQLSEPLDTNDAATGELRVKAHDFVVAGDGTFSCASEAVLLGHDAWLTALHWNPAPLSDSPHAVPPLQLLSASADRSLIIWAPEQTTAIAGGESTTAGSVWTSQQRFGEFSSQTNLGFFGALWGLGGRTVMASGWGGSWHVWRQTGQGSSVEQAGALAVEAWESQVAVSGHMDQVRSLEWEPQGEFLLSTGFDMATRLHAPWRRRSGDRDVTTWHELGRPQIHGYQIASVAFTSRLQFVSGADEKIVRVFDAPKVFVASLRKLSGVDLGDEDSRPMAANVPPLGLSNRAIANNAEADAISESKEEYNAPRPVNFTVEEHPPLEEQLLGSTLWPETEKLYGHGFEINAVAAAHSLPLIATACKATSAEHAVVRMYDTRTWKHTGTVLAGHALTITKLTFSHDDRWLLSVSRDRTWHLYEYVEGDYRPSASAKSHTRIIWDACWAHDDSFFATASRDKSVKIWRKPSADAPASTCDWPCAATLRLEDPATAVAAIVLPGTSSHLLAVGLENGRIHIFSAPDRSDGSDWTPYLVLDHADAHVMAVTSLAWSPKIAGDGTLLLASGSEDRLVRITEISP